MSESVVHQAACKWAAGPENEYLTGCWHGVLATLSMHWRMFSPVPIWLQDLSHRFRTGRPHGTVLVLMVHDREQNERGCQSVSPLHPSKLLSFQRMAPRRDGLHCNCATGFEIMKPFTPTSPCTLTPAWATRLCLTWYPLSDRAIHPSACCRTSTATRMHKHRLYPLLTTCGLPAHDSRDRRQLH